MTKYIKENIIKHTIVLAIVVFLYPVILESLSKIKFEQTNDFLLTISTLLVTVCFANFAFTYEKSKLKTFTGKFLSHSATGIFLLLIGLLLESMIIAVKTIYPFFYFIIFGFAILLYIGIVLYDFWDILRAEQ